MMMLMNGIERYQNDKKMMMILLQYFFLIYNRQQKHINILQFFYSCSHIFIYFYISKLIFFLVI